MNMAINYEEEKEKKKKKQLRCVFIRINPNEENFSVNRSTNVIH